MAPQAEKLARDTVVKLRLTDFACPACGSTARWDRITADEPEHNNPSLLVFCDCGQGELRIVVE